MHLAKTLVASAVCFGLGCAPTVQGGLANAPSLGGSPIAAPRVHDAIANGEDSCERGPERSPGPLRHPLLPCRRESAPASAFVLPPATPENDGAIRWLEHYYVGWPCRGSRDAITSLPLVAWSHGMGTCRSL